MWRGLAIGAVLLASTGCIIHVREGSGNAVTESRDVGPFSGIITEHPFDVDVVLGEK